MAAPAAASSASAFAAAAKPSARPVWQSSSSDSSDSDLSDEEEKKKPKPKQKKKEDTDSDEEEVEVKKKEESDEEEEEEEEERGVVVVPRPAAPAAAAAASSSAPPPPAAKVVARSKAAATAGATSLLKRFVRNHDEDITTGEVVHNAATGEQFVVRTQTLPRANYAPVALYSYPKHKDLPKHADINSLGYIITVEGIESIPVETIPTSVAGYANFWARSPPKWRGTLESYIYCTDHLLHPVESYTWNGILRTCKITSKTAVENKDKLAERNHNVIVDNKNVVRGVGVMAFAVAQCRWRELTSPGGPPAPVADAADEEEDGTALGKRKASAASSSSRPRKAAKVDGNHDGPRAMDAVMAGVVSDFLVNMVHASCVHVAQQPKHAGSMASAFRAWRSSLYTEAMDANLTTNSLHAFRAGMDKYFDLRVKNYQPASQAAFMMSVRMYMACSMEGRAMLDAQHVKYVVLDRNDPAPAVDESFMNCI